MGAVAQAGVGRSPSAELCPRGCGEWPASLRQGQPGSSLVGVLACWKVGPGGRGLPSGLVTVSTRSMVAVVWAWMTPEKGRVVGWGERNAAAGWWEAPEALHRGCPEHAP